ncbi:MAG: M15 family metallopeptidase [Pseudomonadota bacterium]|nr:M15 family metallopeptidase [Pseudomonadota bacterium]
MFLVALFAYFLLAVFALALGLFPAFRQRVFGTVARVWQGGCARWRRWRQGSARMAAGSARSVKQAGAGFGRFVVEQRVLWAGAAGLMAAGVLLGVLFGRGNILFFEDASRDVDAKVDALLKGEQLVPPPPLPPEVFATAEVEQVRPLTKEGSRDWGALDVDFRNRLLVVYKLMKERHGYDLALLEGYRSPERQARLAALGGHVTQAKANQSYHQYGLAADNAFYREGRLVISEKDPWAMEGYRLYGEVAESLGLVWGGRWSFKDYGHVEYRKPGFRLPRD